MISWTTNGVQITIPELSWSMLDGMPWWYAVIPFIAYGIFTHFVSLPGIHRYNKKLRIASGAPGLKEEERENLTKKYEICHINQGEMLGLLLARISGVPLLRIVLFIAGLIYIPISVITTGFPRIWNGAFKTAWTWYDPPEKYATEWTPPEKEAESKS